jgi:hypothetical protein
MLTRSVELILWCMFLTRVISSVGTENQVHVRSSLFAELMSFVLFICRPVQSASLPRVPDTNIWTAINLSCSSHDNAHVSYSKASFRAGCITVCFCALGLLENVQQNLSRLLRIIYSFLFRNVNTKMCTKPYIHSSVALQLFVGPFLHRG